MIHIPDHIKVLKPYKSGNQVGKQITREAFKKLVNLASNENPLGASPLAIEAIKNNISDIAVYPNPSAPDLVNAIAKHFNKPAECIITGSGSDSIIADVFKAFTVEGQEIIMADATFIGAFVNANKLNRTIVKVPLKNDYSYDLNAMLKAISRSTRIIYLANPNNPTGVMATKKEFEDFMKKVPSDVLVVLDEAYYAYSGEYEDCPNGLDYECSNLIVLRTMSKSYGLAGIRVGFAIGPKELIDFMYRVKLPFEPNILAQKAAEAALEDKEFIKLTIETNKRNLAKLKEFFTKIGIKHTDGKANFTMIELKDGETANKFAAESLEQGFVVRPLGMFGLPNCIRINSGTDEQTDRAIKVFENVLAKLK
ncbi:MAG: histidinol-phosphate transaminase [Candidatus Kapaibacterium sp.]|nr:histidinol-phosphate transaminase [Ignavibacteriota bacterium]MCB9221935.1 histidinol-phosphate transaminase [Ignavibacteria bacterium]